MAAIVSPATGDTATAAWADSVADQLNQMHAFMTLANPNATSTGAGTATWVTMGSVTVPDWATKARVCLSMAGITATLATSQADIAVKIGTAVNVGKRVFGTAAGRMAPATINDLLTSVPTGSQSVTVQATFQVSTFSAGTTAVTFDLNIDWLA
jgi:hypothetical protein